MLDCSAVVVGPGHGLSNVLQLNPPCPVLLQLVLLGVCVGPGGASSDPQAELTLQPLPLYSIPSDNVVLTCCASTPGGRIFLGGADGHVYELHYSAHDTWRQRRCYKVGKNSSIWMAKGPISGNSQLQFIRACMYFRMLMLFSMLSLLV